MPLEVCPTSNVLLGVCDSLASHPLPRLLEAGLYVTLNTDDPPMFNTTLIEEYERCAEAFDLNVDQLSQLILNAFNAALLPATEQEALAQQVEIELGQLRHQLEIEP
jgi:adenosine deaminase